MSSPAAPDSLCPKCATPGTGRFCTECGAPLAGATCNGCQAPLTPGSKFCHRCGMAAGAQLSAPQTSGAMGSSPPWLVAGTALLALLAMLAGRGFNGKRGSTLDAPANAIAQPGLDDRGAAGSDPAAANPSMGADLAPFAGAAAGAGGVRAPDISKLSPTEIADRLYNRVMMLSSEGKSDSVQFFAPMALQAYAMVQQQQGTPLNADQRYDIGRIAEAAGAIPLAKAQADTILQQQPSHLLGLILAERVAVMSGNTPARREYQKRLIAAAPAERAKKLDEYQRHANDIDSALADARASR